MQMTTTELEKQIADLEAKERAQLEAGASDEDLERTGRAIAIAKKRLPVVRDQEIRAAAEEADRRRKALEPEALKARDEAALAHVFARFFAAVDQAVESVAAELLRVPELRARFVAAQAHAMDICPRASVAFAPERADDSTLALMLRRRINDKLRAADIPSGLTGIVPPIYFADRSTIGRPM